jgi:hypothetical protein
MELEVKGMTLKALSERGEGEALFALWSPHEDHDGDLTEKGFFGNGVQEVFMLPHHLWTSGQPPIAKGIIYERPNGAVYEFKMNTETELGAAWHSHFLFDLREGRAPQQKWSYGFRVKPDGSSPRPDGRKGRRLHASKSDGSPGALVIEVSPVTAASQQLSRTLTAKTDGAPLTPTQLATARRIERWLGEMLAERRRAEQLEAKRLRLTFLERSIQIARWRVGV